MIPQKQEDYFTRYNGTPHFAAPEIARGRKYQGPQAEVWTLGVLLYTITFGENPFQDKKEILAYTGSLTFPREINYDLKSLLKALLNTSPDRRITLGQIRKHPWCSDAIEDLST